MLLEDPLRPVEVRPPQEGGEEASAHRRVVAPAVDVPKALSAIPTRQILICVDWESTVAPATNKANADTKAKSRKWSTGFAAAASRRSARSI